MPYRLLSTVHHIKSRAKIQALSRAATIYKVSVLIKMTAKPPGFMICEADSESDARSWLAVLKGLRYKGYWYVKGEMLSGQRKLLHGKDGLRAVSGAEEFVNELTRFSETGENGQDIKAWWREAMGYKS